MDSSIVKVWLNGTPATTRTLPPGLLALRVQLAIACPPPEPIASAIVQPLTPEPYMWTSAGFLGRGWDVVSFFRASSGFLYLRHTAPWDAVVKPEYTVNLTAMPAQLLFRVKALCHEDTWVESIVGLPLRKRGATPAAKPRSAPKSNWHRLRLGF